MKIKVIGCGNAFSKKNGNQMFLVEENGRRMAIDFGFQAGASLDRNGYTLFDVDDVYISHQHADHIGGLEELAFTRYDWVTKPQKAENFAPFLPSAPHLYCEEGLMDSLWKKSLSGGLESMEGFVATLDTFFITNPIDINKGFKWEGWLCEPVQQVHIMAGSRILPSYGLFMSKEGHKSVYFTTDTQYNAPKQIISFLKRADIIFQDCEIEPYMSGVHANYIELAGYPEANAMVLPVEIRKKMLLSHYQDIYLDGKKRVVENSEYPFYRGEKNGLVDFDWDKQAQEDGFAGFTYVGQAMEI